MVGGSQRKPGCVIGSMIYTPCCPSLYVSLCDSLPLSPLSVRVSLSHSLSPPIRAILSIFLDTPRNSPGVYQPRVQWSQLCAVDTVHIPFLP